MGAASDPQHPSLGGAGLSGDWACRLPKLQELQEVQGQGCGSASHSCPLQLNPPTGTNLCPLHWQAESSPLGHQESPGEILLICVL